MSSNKLLTIVASAYRCEAHLDPFLRNIAACHGFEQYRLLLILNAPTSGEMEIAQRHRELFPDNIEIVAVDRESIGASTNRGFRLATSPYVAYADVDDLKTPECFESLLDTLERNPSVGFTYGDFMIVSRQGATAGRLVCNREFNAAEFTRGSFVGPGHLFRRELLDNCGFWDEQLRSGGDFDFQIRAALHTTFKRTPTLCTYYTRAPVSTSASSGDLQGIEALVLALRYGIYDKVHFYLHHLPDVAGYRICECLSEGRWDPVSRWVPNYDTWMSERRDALWSKGFKSCAVAPLRHWIQATGRRIRSAVQAPQRSQRRTT